MKAMLPGHFRRMAELMQPLSIAERKTLVHLLGKIHQQQGAQMSPGPEEIAVEPAAVHL